MKWLWFLGLSSAIGIAGAPSANADTIEVTAYTGSAADPTTPLATLDVTRTAVSISGTNWDEIDINLASWSMPSWQTGGPDGIGAEVQALGGTFTAVGVGAGISLPGNAAQWEGRTTWDYANGTPSSAAPASFVNLENTTGTAVRTGTSPDYTSFSDGWFAKTGGAANLGVTDLSPPTNPALDDSKDETLLARLYVTPGANVSFVADPANGVDGFGTTAGTVYMAFSTLAVPEPSTMQLLAIGLLGLWRYAAAKRR